ncbi:hypothetical protein PMKS-000306 [Pichia membranifaciens]|uniref:Rad4 beta-hairpin domain-containing protein n=1 Tax=Pichia membranifaciens TaxID=4926 RepID=A0A1Q2YBC4_9ASCO|nr:hypothetical protein PMKS-000306 [Pichia membranifaciens]
MLRNALKEEKANDEKAERPLKRARRLQTPVQRAREIRNMPPPRKQDHERYIVHLDDNSSESTFNSGNRRFKSSTSDTARAQQNEVIDLSDDSAAYSVGSERRQPNSNESGGEEVKGDDEKVAEEEEEEDEDVDSDEFEDVDLNETSFLGSGGSDDDKEVVSITMKQHRATQKPSQRATVVSKEERVYRRVLHLLHLFAMVGHGVSRNVWISDPQLLLSIQKQVPDVLKHELKQYQAHRVKTTVTAQSKTRKLLDFLRHLMEYWLKVWTVDFRAPVLYKKTWTELKYPQLLHPSKTQKLTKQKFRNMILTHTGSRDIAAQGFVALLRSLNLPARLVFSIQSPDFTNMKKCDEKAAKNHEADNSKEVLKPSPIKGKGKSVDRILARLRSKKAYKNTSVKTQDEHDDEYGERYGSWPVFWVEVWDKDSKKYITIDPIVKKFIEVVSWKSKLEPPMNCVRNNAWYVIGYDRVGGVRDITRRYAKEYNAKVRKKRITREVKWEAWWTLLLRGACSRKRLKDNRVDKFEKIEFEELELKEGMPANISDFKGHPVYVLERDLKFNEILMPKISCGGISKKGKITNNADKFIPVYKRSNVHIVRTARGWFMRGRVLKMGERPVKIREKKVKKRKGKKGTEDEFQLSDEENEEDGDDGRLYAESQTEKYAPPPVVNGIIPKNAFKNVDVYQPWMIPDGCVHVKNKLAEKAARLMEIEYAPAVIGFDFTGTRRDASAKIEGIVTLKEYEEAVKLICEGLSEMEEEERRMHEDLINLRAWRILLAKLKISKRLLHEHGEVEDDEEEKTATSDDEAGDSDSEEFETGGFVLGNPEAQNTASSRTRSHYTDHPAFETEVPGSDISASDFDSDIDNGEGEAISIRQISSLRRGKNKKSRKRDHEEENESGGFTLGKASESMLGTRSGLTMENNELVYNPDGGDVEMSDEEEDERDHKKESNDGLDQNRMKQLDQDFADFMGGMEDNVEDMNDKGSGSVEDKQNLNGSNENKTEDEGRVELEEAEKRSDDNYDFEYSD